MQSNGGGCVGVQYWRVGTRSIGGGRGCGRSAMAGPTALRASRGVLATCSDYLITRSHWRTRERPRDILWARPWRKGQAGVSTLECWYRLHSSVVSKPQPTPSPMVSIIEEPLGGSEAGHERGKRSRLSYLFRSQGSWTGIKEFL